MLSNFKSAIFTMASQTSGKHHLYLLIFICSSKKKENT